MDANLEENEQLVFEASPEITSHTNYNLIKFLVPSVLGALLFLTPFVFGGKVTIGMGVLADTVKDATGDYLAGFAVLLTVISIVVTLIVNLSKPATDADTGGTIKSHLIHIFHVGPVWTLLRLVGAVFCGMIFFQVGPEWIIGEATGGLMLNELATVIVVYLMFASLLLPLLTDFGFMEFIGTVFRRFFRTVFQLPGRSAIDALASWLGAGTVGVMITAQQYESGYYSQREAAIIATNFSIVSVAFCLVVVDFIGINHLFGEYYVAVVLAGIACAIITPRIPPLSWKKDIYHAEAGKQIAEEVPAGHSMFSWGLRLATARAQHAPGPVGMLVKGGLNGFDIWFGLLPLVMAIGTVALALAEFTPVFNYLGAPFIPLLELLRIPEAAAAAPTMVVGFADMFLPAVLGKGIESELTRFVIAGVSVSQLIFMSEVGVLMLKTKLPLNFIELLAIFLIRTLISLPIVAGVGHLLL
ncbi:MAG: YjiH family protein [Motiliproteus sp.]